MTDLVNDTHAATPEGVESSVEQQEMSADERAEAKRYGKVSLACAVADMVIDVVYLAVAALVLAAPLDAWLASFAPLSGPQSLARLAALAAIVIAGHALVSLPLSFFAGFVVEHHFQLSNQSIARWLRNWALRNGLALPLGLVLYGGLFWIIWNAGAYWWLIAAAAFFVVTVVLGQLTPVLVIPLFQRVEPIEDQALLARMQRLAEGTGLTIEGVYRQGLSADTKKINAMLAGLGSTRRVLMGDTLLEKFSPAEIDVIFAHEIGHHVHRHIPKMIATGVVISVGLFWLCDRVLLWWSAAESAATIPTSALPMAMFALTLATLALGPLQNFISRHYERQCDRYALDRTGDRPAYRAAFAKLARLNKADPNPHPIEVFLLDSHPPIAERIAMADE